MDIDAILDQIDTDAFEAEVVDAAMVLKDNVVAAALELVKAMLKIFREYLGVSSAE